MKQSLSTPVVFAHRGASAHAPENTLAAFQLAIDQGAKAIEIDVQLTRDQEVVVFHDVYLDRLTDGSGKVEDLTLSEIKTLNTGLAFSPSNQNQTIPTLKEVLDFLPDDIFINIELKNLHSPFDDLPALTSSIVVEKKAQNRVLISSFNVVALYKLTKAAKNLPLGLLLRTSWMAILRSIFPSLHKKYYSIHLAFSILNPQLLSKFKRSGTKVFSYTLNHTQDILTAVNMGIDGFFTDDPGFAYRVLAQHGHLKDGVNN